MFVASAAAALTNAAMAACASAAARCADGAASGAAAPPTSCSCILVAPARASTQGRTEEPPGMAEKCLDKRSDRQTGRNLAGNAASLPVGSLPTWQATATIGVHVLAAEWRGKRTLNACQMPTKGLSSHLACAAVQTGGCAGRRQTPPPLLPPLLRSCCRCCVAPAAAHAGLQWSGGRPPTATPFPAAAPIQQWGLLKPLLPHLPAIPASSTSTPCLQAAAPLQLPWRQLPAHPRSPATVLLQEDFRTNQHLSSQ